MYVSKWWKTDEVYVYVQNDWWAHFWSAPNSRTANPLIQGCKIPGCYISLIIDYNTIDPTTSYSYPTFYLLMDILQLFIKILNVAMCKFYNPSLSLYLKRNLNGFLPYKLIENNRVFGIKIIFAYRIISMTIIQEEELKDAILCVFANKQVSTVSYYCHSGCF